MTWTDEQFDLAKRLWDEGLTASHVAARIGCGMTRNAVLGKLNRSGILRGISAIRAARPAPIRDVIDGRKGNGGKHVFRKPAPLKPEKVSVAKVLPWRGEPLDDAVLRAPIVVVPPPQPRGDKPTLMGLEAFMCKFPYGDPLHPEFHFCGASTESDKIEEPYCPGHRRESRQSFNTSRWMTKRALYGVKLG